MAAGSTMPMIAAIYNIFFIMIGFLNCCITVDNSGIEVVDYQIMLVKIVAMATTIAVIVVMHVRVSIILNV